MPKIIKACRKRANSSQESLASKLDCSRSDISKYENNFKSMKIDRFQRLCEVTNSKDAFMALLSGQEGLNWLIKRFEADGLWE
ncbi:hypothetical protein A7975_17925 [Bacillus sp. FJAT-26390]|nr:hypothetical protein A7975_17925 [Bacillus sp. FJAT-26390]